MLHLLVLAALAQDPPTCEEPLDTYLAALRQDRSREAYLCLARRDEAGAFLVAEIGRTSDEDEGQSAVTRALAVHLAQRLDRPLTADEVRALDPSDRRLLRDAIYARKGRKSPSEDHEKVFSQFSWYQPDERFTNRRLDANDRANMAIIDHPPPLPEPPDDGPEPAIDAMNEARQQGAGRCGCASALVGPWWLALFALGWRRR